MASGRGYGAALLARLVNAVVAVEAEPAWLVRPSRPSGSWESPTCTTSPGRWKPVAGEGPYDVILIEGAVQHVPAAILGQLAEGGRLGTVIAGASAGRLGVAQLIVKEGGVASGRPLFDAGTPALPGFATPPRFTF